MNPTASKSVEISTSGGRLRGIATAYGGKFLGIRYATASRFEYAREVDLRDGVCGSFQFGPTCPQSRGYYEHLEIPERMFYHREFRDGLTFHYDEDCLNLNVYVPTEALEKVSAGDSAPSGCPVILYFYGGGFNSGASSEDAFDGEAFAKRGVILVTANYRVGVLGYLTHEDIKAQYGHEGNFGLDDQAVALRFVHEHIADFGGDPDNITLMGQSAGAISIQYLCLSDQCKGLFRHVVMMSGGGCFPKFALPRKAEDTREYWKQLMSVAGVKTLEELRALPLEPLFAAVETLKGLRKDNTYSTMPVIDGLYLTGPVDQLIRHPLPVDYMLGYTNNDMVAILMAIIAQRYARANHAYTYYFDIDAKGDDHNGAFHSSDLRYMFGTLQRSFRPYTEADYRASDLLIDYVSAFARTGDPNGNGRPRWEKLTKGSDPFVNFCGGKTLHITEKGAKMALPGYLKLLWNTITKGDPK